MEGGAPKRLRLRPAGAVKNHSLGTQAAPVCEGGGLAPGRPSQYIRDVMGWIRLED